MFVGAYLINDSNVQKVKDFIKTLEPNVEIYDDTNCFHLLWDKDFIKQEIEYDYSYDKVILNPDKMENLISYICEQFCREFNDENSTEDVMLFIHDKVKEYKGTIITLHNHPNSSEPSITDILSMYKNGKVEVSIIACHNGDVYKISNMNRKIDLVKEYQLIYNEVKTKYMVKDYVLRITKDEFLLKAKQHGWFNFEVFKNGKKE